MATLTQEMETPENQIAQTQRVVADAVRKALRPLGKEAAQRVHEKGDELVLGIQSLIQGLSTVEDYADEQVESSYHYPPGYYQVRPIEEQIEIIAKKFDLDSSFALQYIKKLPRLPQEAEGWFAVPRWEALASIYGEGAKQVLDTLLQSFNVGWSHRVSTERLHRRFLRESRETRRAMDKIVRQQGEVDILVLPAQLGFNHRGKSARRARVTFQRKEFGLGVVAVGAILLTHPERVGQPDTGRLEISCIGDEYCSAADDQFTHVLGFEPSLSGSRSVYPMCRASIGNYAWHNQGHVTGFLL